jgi:hypothetical protein
LYEQLHLARLASTSRPSNALVCTPGRAGVTSPNAGARAANGDFGLFASANASRGTSTQIARKVDDIDATVHELPSRGVGLEQYNLPGLRTAYGIAEIDGNYPSKGIGERAAWFRDSEGNMSGIAQPVRAPPKGGR